MSMSLIVFFSLTIVGYTVYFFLRKNGKSQSEAKKAASKFSDIFILLPVIALVVILFKFGVNS